MDTITGRTMGRTTATTITMGPTLDLRTSITTISIIAADAGISTDAGAVSDVAVSVPTMTGADVSAEEIAVLVGLSRPTRPTWMMTMRGTIIAPRAISGNPGGVIGIVKASVVGASP